MMTEKEVELSKDYARLHGTMLALAFTENLYGNKTSAINICKALKSSLENSSLLTKYEWMIELEKQLSDLTQ
jgi:hypothetical protein